MEQYASTQRRAYAYTIDLILLYLFCSFCINSLPGMDRLIFHPNYHPHKIEMHFTDDEQQIIDEAMLVGQQQFDNMGIRDVTPLGLIEWYFIPQTWGELTGDIIYLLYFSLLIAMTPWQATLGMKMLNIHVSTTYDEPPFLQQAVIRYLVSIFNNYTLIGWLMIYFTKRRQGLHDLLADTVVLKGSPKPSAYSSPQA